MSAIRIENIHKSYEETEALKGINLEVNEGELFGLIGPDGAGKTSLIRILTTLILADEGNAEVIGYDVVKDYKKLRMELGYMPGRFSLYYDLTILENITLFATIFGTTLEENYDLVKDIYGQIEPFKHRRAGQLSGGMKQKLALSCALIHAPKILFLDEPTTGVDAVSRREFWEMLGKLKARGITIFVSTPYMDEASLCDRVALIQEGNILQIDTPQGIVDQFDRELFAVKSARKYQLLEDLRTYPHAHSVHAFGEFIHYTDQRNDFQASTLNQYLTERGHEQLHIAQVDPNIEDCFMALM
ncbi:MAG: ABC transporter ATP-binding protein [Bacteroidetes bacterium]|nr:ABC transporter ATP-binding protein [Bacteroidota bacterium]MCB0852158.1 ABC transporter ATP-binding protein [Bacteroidota bacterium]